MAFCRLPALPTPPVAGTLYASGTVVNEAGYPVRPSVKVPVEPETVRVTCVEVLKPRPLLFSSLRTPPVWTTVDPVYVFVPARMRVPPPKVVRVAGAGGVG